MEAPRHCSLILLTGPKHAGKTSAGRALAALGGGDFIDLDELVREQTGKSPRALFREGPEVFRRAEAEALESLLRMTEAGGPGSSRWIRTAAAGGGLIDNPEARSLLAGAPRLWIVYLDLSPETAWERIERTAAETGELPPFLDTADPRGTHFVLHTRRAAEYRKIAHHTVEAGGKSPEQIAGEIASLAGLSPEGGF